MRTAALTRSIIAIATVIAVLMGGDTSRADEQGAAEPPTSTIRIRLKGPTLRVRCRGGDCEVSIVRAGTSFAVSITRTIDGVPFTFARTVENPTNLAVETGIGTDTISLVNVAVPGFLRIGSASGDDLLDLPGTSTAGKASIDTGSGNDTVHLDAGIFGGKFRLFARSGNDEVSITDGSFAGKAAFDGGPGTDTFFTTTNPFAEPPVIVGFEP